MAKCIHDGCGCEAGQADAPYCSAHCREQAKQGGSRKATAAQEQEGTGCGCEHTDCR
jgi:hypothetical protein